MKNKITLGLAAIVLIAYLTNCGKVPKEQIDAVNAAIDSAAKVDAHVYLPAEFKAIQDSLRAIMADIEIQNPMLVKKYGPAKVKLDKLLSEIKIVKANAAAKKEEIEEIEGSIKRVTEELSKNTPKDTTAIDTNKEIQKPKESRVPQKTARLAYSYYPEMTRYESKDINVFISIIHQVDHIRDTLIKIITQQQNASTGKVDSDSIVTSEISIYKRIRVDLLDLDSSFKIQKIFGETWQDIDSTGDNRWRWNVTPITNATNARLVIKVIAETPAGTVKDIEDRTFYIKVKMIGTYQVIRSWWAYLQDNPGMVVTVILIPLVAFLGKRFFDRKQKNKT